MRPDLGDVALDKPVADVGQGQALTDLEDRRFRFRLTGRISAPTTMPATTRMSARRMSVIGTSFESASELLMAEDGTCSWSSCVSNGAKLSLS